jgi:drug/metabolite transporter (DMT)-like permease
VSQALRSKKNLIAVAALLSVGAAWGGAFVLMKDAINQQPFFDFLAIRFTLATALMIVIRPSVITKMSRKTLTRGGILGLLLGAAYVTQTAGLLLTSAAITGFITGLYVIFTPFLTWLIFRQLVSKRVMFGTVLATLGLALISIQGWSIEVNHLWVVLSALLFAAHIVGLGRWSPGSDVYALTVVQLAVTAGLCWVGALPDGYQPPPNGEVWWAVIFTVVFSTAFAFLVQTWAQSVMDSSRVAIILTSEVVFTAIIAVAVGQESLALKVVIGGALLVTAMLVVEWPSKK